MDFSRTDWKAGVIATFVAAGFGAGPAVAATVIDFEQYSDGDVVGGEIAPGVHFTVNNVNGSPDIGAAWDATGHPRFDGLNVPWSTGNIDPNYDPGIGVLIQDIGSNTPVPEGSRPNGDMTFEFDNDITSFGFDIYDIDGPEEFQTHTGYFIAFYDDDTLVGQFTFEDMTNPASAIYDPNYGFADGSANRIAPVTATELGVGSFDKVVVAFGGSGFLDNVTFDGDSSNVIPSPAAAGAGAVMAGLALLRRRRA